MWSPLPPHVSNLFRGPTRPLGSRSWAEAVREIDGYRTLTDDYDGQGAKAPSADVFNGAAELARGLMKDGVPAPSGVVPGPNGSLNLEWDYPEQVSVGIEVTGPDEADVFLLVPGREPGYWVLNQTATV